MTNNNDVKLAFLPVVRAIEGASTEELEAIGRLELALSAVPITQAAEQVKVFDPLVHALNRAPDDDGDFAPVVKVEAPKLEREPVPASYSNTTSNNTTANVTTTSNTANAVTDNSANNANDTLTVINNTQSKPAPFKEAGSQSTTVIERNAEQSHKQSQETNQLLEGLYEDSQGRLRKENGAFASRQQKEAHDKAKVEKSDAGDSSTFKTVASFLAKTIDSKAEDSGVVDSAGAAVGNSFWIAAKEIKDGLGEAKELVADKGLNTQEGRKEKLDSLVNVVKNPMSLLRGQNTENGTPEVNDTNLTPSDSSQTKQITETIALLGDVASDVQNQSDSNENTSINSVNHSSDTQSSAAEQLAETNTLLSDATSNMRNQSDSTERESIAEAKATRSDAASQADGFRKLSEGTETQTSTLEMYHKQQIEALKDISLVAGGAAVGGGGLEDFFDFDGKDKKRRKRGKRSRKGKFGKLAGKFKMPSALSTMTEGGTSLFGKAGGAASKMGGTAAKAGGSALKMGGTMLRGAGKALPFLAPALAIFDAVQGFNDTEGQQKAFNLKDGQEATTGQKSSMSAANLLDMGGLVSGGAGLLGSLMGSMGFEGAQEALTFDTEGMAKGIYSLFGGNGKEEPVKEASSRSESSPNNNIDSGTEASNKPDLVDTTDPEKKGEYFNDAVDQRRIDQGVTRRHKKKRSQQRRDKSTETISRVNALAESEGIPYQEAYQRDQQEQKRKENERQTVAKEIGVDISGQVNPGNDRLISPKKKADQLAVVDAEIAKRAADKKALAEAVKTSDDSNHKFIGPAMTVANTIEPEALELGNAAATPVEAQPTPAAKAYVAEEGSTQENKSLLASGEPASTRQAEKSRPVIARIDPKLTKALEKLATQTPAPAQTTQTTEVIKSENKATTTQIPASFNDPNLKLIALDIN